MAMRIRPSASFLLVLAACGSSAMESPGASGPPVPPRQVPPDSGDGGSLPDMAPDAEAGSPGVPRLPKSTGVCPPIQSGDVTFAPAGVPPRKVKLALEQPGKQGPLLLYWHATGSSPAEAAYSLGATQATWTSAGGIVAAPYADPTAGQFGWFIVNQSPKLDDFLVADEIVACLVEARRIDPARIHSLGMSAGALQTTALSYLRSSYLASVSTFSGGAVQDLSSLTEDPGNKFAALVFHGGATDALFGVDFQAASESYRSNLSAAGHFAAICDHGKGHTIPRDAAPSVATFFAVHPFGASPSPYASGLPASFPAYCKR